MTFNIFCQYYYPRIGGIERFVYCMSRELYKHGHIVNVITTNTYNLPFKTKINGITIYRLRSFDILHDRYAIPYSLKEISFIYRECFKNEKIVTILNTRFFIISLLGTTLGTLKKAKNIILEHGSGHIQYDTTLMKIIAKIYEHVITFILRLYQPHFFGVSKAAVIWLRHFNIYTKHIINNGVYKQTDSQKKQSKTIFYGGRLIKEKGIIELIEGFKLFSKKNPSYKLLLAGSGELESEIKKQIKSSKNIKFIHFMSHKKVMEYLKQSFLFVNPSNYIEGMPTILLEAASCKLPIISTPNGGAKEIIKHKQTGYIIASGTSDLIYKALIYMKTHPKNAKKMGENIYEIIKKDYNWPIIVDKFLKEIK